eukprot:5485546-Amphidinium_carterae.1
MKTSFILLMLMTFVIPASTAPKMSQLLDAISKASTAAKIAEIPPDFAYVGGSPLAIRQQLLAAICDVGSSVEKDDQIDLGQALFIVAIFTMAALSAIAGPMQVLSNSINVGKAPKLTEAAQRACRTVSCLVVHLSRCPSATRNSVPLAIPEVLISSMTQSRPATGLLALPLEPALRSEIND